MCLKEDEDSEPAQWRKLAKERVSRSVDAALVILLVGEHCRFDAGSVYQEESIEVLIQVLNFQLQSSIFPEYDSYYRLSSEKKGKLSYPSISHWHLAYAQSTMKPGINTAEMEWTNF